MRVPASASSLPSAQSRSGSWHVAHETLPEPESRGSKKSQRPKCAAASSPSCAFVGSSGGGGSGECASTRATSAGSKPASVRAVSAGRSASSNTAASNLPPLPSASVRRQSPPMCRSIPRTR